MFQRKWIIGILCVGLLCFAAPASAQKPGKGIDPQTLAAAAKNCPGLQGVDMNALAAAINACPGLQDMSPAAIVEAMQNCPGLQGTAGVNCPALNGNITPEQLAVMAAKCPALQGAGNCPAQAGQGTCPALDGSMGPANQKLAKKAEARMQRIVRALERNKKSADTLIQAARDAGADPNAIADLEKMSQAFRNVFMSVVSPQQIIESMLSRPAPEPQQGDQGPMIFTGPDGTQYLVTPNGPMPLQAVPQGDIKAPRDGKKAPREGRPGGFKGPMQGAPGQPGMTPPPPAPQGQPGMIPPHPGKHGGFKGPMGGPTQGFVPPAPQGQPGMTPPPPAPQGQPGMTPPPGMRGGFKGPQGAPQGRPAIQQPAPQPEMIVIEEETEYLPLWPTKEDLGKGGVLEYLQKRQQALDNAR